MFYLFFFFIVHILKGNNEIHFNEKSLFFRDDNYSLDILRESN